MSQSDHVSHLHHSPDFVLKPNPFHFPLSLHPDMPSSPATGYRVSAFGVSGHRPTSASVSVSPSASATTSSSHLVHPGMANGKPGGGDCAKLCPRHQRMANEGTNRQLQNELETLPEPDQEAINTVWGLFSASNGQRRRLILSGLLTICCPSQLTFLTDSLRQVCRIDPFSRLPKELSLRILSYFDAFSLGKAAQVSKRWRKLADDDLLWRTMCEQHIERKCQKCGWGLPLMEKRKRAASGEPELETDRKRACQQDPSEALIASFSSSSSSASSSSSVALAACHLPDTQLQPEPSPALELRTTTKPWKIVYTERLALERNWRKGLYHETVLTGHTDSITCLQLDDQLASPAYPVLMTGSWDRTIRVWNADEGETVRVLKGHTRGIRCLQFDSAKLITGAMDGLLKLWNWRTGECIRTIEGHTDGVICLRFDQEILASGSADATIRIWNFKTGAGYVLRGHREWVNSVEVWSSGETKLLFSGSDDGHIRVWDLATRETVRVLDGHMAQVQSIRAITLIEDHPEPSALFPGASRPFLVSGSLDNCLKVWDIERGVCARTMFGHIEGVWNVDADKLRVVSGSHDRSLKIWDRVTGKCVHTIVGHRAAVMAISLRDDKIVSGGDDGEVRIWSFAPRPQPRTHFHHHHHHHHHHHLHDEADQDDQKCKGKALQEDLAGSVKEVLDSD
ncbi:hypothetical protein CROQUDRAFT_39553 [Cronartium quercuum f. sp. fusiforme G11]|nr:hypothetical protein CROQUDRAFT_39553 [Cronartium quercuum f. sp. fusiforme G11]